MKKYFKTIMLAAVAVLGMTTFAACGSDDDPKGEDEKKPTSGEFIYNFYLNEAMLEVGDITITYTDCNGKETTETVTANKCSDDIPAMIEGPTLCYTKKIKATALPATSGYQVTWTRNQNELRQDSYEICYGMYYAFQTNLDSGTVLSSGNTTRGTVDKKKIETYIESYGEGKKITCSVNAEGLPE